MKEKLWNKNFTIITLGTVVSMLGNSVSGFAIGLLVLDYTNSTFLYAFFMVMYHLPKIVLPLFAGPYVDRFSRKTIIYCLDFCSAGIYLLLFILIWNGIFHYGAFLLAVLVVGTIDGVYQVAYESLYPNLISKGNYSKAYSISSMIYPLAACMIPVASFVYYGFGTAAPLFLFNAVSFLVAAIFETRIDFRETHIEQSAITEDTSKYDFKKYKADFKEGIAYLKSEKGLGIITAYFGITMFCSSAFGTLGLPFFKNNPELFAYIPIQVVTLFAFVSAFGVFGRLVGGFIHYKIKIPTKWKFTIAICVYTIVTILDSVLLFLPMPFMLIGFFAIGILGVTSFNIRISATQSYIPDAKRGRFNGVFAMVCAAGMILGQLLAGALGEFFPERGIIVLFDGINLLAVIFVMYTGKEFVKKIYNREV